MHRDLLALVARQNVVVAEDLAADLLVVAVPLCGQGRSALPAGERGVKLLPEIRESEQHLLTGVDQCTELDGGGVIGAIRRAHISGLDTGDNEVDGVTNVRIPHEVRRRIE